MNVKSLFHKPEKFTNYDPNSPAAKAAQRWDEREGQIVEQNQNLRKLTIGLMVTIIVLGGGLVYRSLSSTMVPYVVTYDSSTGEIRGVGTAQEMRDFQPTNKMTEYFVKQFLNDVRSVPIDPVVYKKNLTEAQIFVTKDGASLLASKMRDEKLTDKFGKKTVQVQIHSMVPMEGGKSYQIRWSEDEYDISGNSKTVTTYTGIFTVEHIDTKDEEQLMKNPAGIYVSNFSWSKDTGGEPSATQAKQQATPATATTNANR